MQNVKGERVYPSSKVAAIIVWLLDRLPENTRHQVLGSYWSHREIVAIDQRADEMFRQFGKPMDD
jgi:hypothetical protein